MKIIEESSVRLVVIIIPLSVFHSYKNYGQDLGREKRRQLIPIKKSADKGVPRLEKNKKTWLHDKDKLIAYK